MINYLNKIIHFTRKDKSRSRSTFDVTLITNYERNCYFKRNRIQLLGVLISIRMRRLLCRRLNISTRRALCEAWRTSYMLYIFRPINNLYFETHSLNEQRRIQSGEIKSFAFYIFFFTSLLFLFSEWQ